MPNSSDSTQTMGSSSDNWGHSWNADEFSNSNFVLEINYDDPGSGCDTSGGSRDSISVDLLQVRVSYTAPKADLVVTKTNNVGGNVTAGQTFTWTLTVTNNGDAAATFNNQNILRDDLPTDLSYSQSNNLTVTNTGGTTGSIDCDINSNTLDCDDNSGGSTVVIPAGGGFSVSITATAETVGTYANPRSGNGMMCRVDPDSLISESNEQNNNCSDTVVVSYTEAVSNPELMASCGYDIALVIDNSTSINDTELDQMKSAMVHFVDDLAGSNTMFSVVSFADTATVRLAFTADSDAVKTAINAIPQGGGATNWEDALVKANSTFDPRSGKQNMILFASDGNPNRVDNGTSTTEADAVNQAIVEANTIKSDRLAHITTIGIGNDLNSDNLAAISSPSDVITTNFDTIANDLPNLNAFECDATLVVEKVVNNNHGGVAVASDFSFSVNGGDSTQFESDGSNSVTIKEGVAYTVTEGSHDGYSVSYDGCENVTVNAAETAYCTITNDDIAPTVTVNKWIKGDTGNTYNFEATDTDGFSLSNGESYQFSPDAGDVTISEEAGDSWMTIITCYNGADQIFNGYASDVKFTTVLGQNYTCDFINTEKATITIVKFNDANGNGVMDEGELPLSGWDLQANITGDGGEFTETKSATTGEDGTVTFDVLGEFAEAEGLSFTTSETLKAGWTQTGMYCGEPTLPAIDVVNEVQLLDVQSDSNELVPGGSYTCYIGNKKKVITDVLSETITKGTLSNTGANSTSNLMLALTILVLAVLSIGLKSSEKQSDK
ncbi:VWA domain-containing protein [Candidatus Saccharibacteria bacterium]|nr:VWA domain-containing protein [Candidatus Saccharibacteria bacterium]